MTQSDSRSRKGLRQRPFGMGDAVLGSADVAAPDGARFTLHDQGAGPAILLLHGGSGNWQAWQFVTRHLRERFHVFAFDRRPYRHVDEPIVTTMAAEVDDAIAAARHIAGPVVLVGHSSGAIVALEAALAAPGTFAGVLLYEPPLAVSAPLGGQALVRARTALDAGKPGRAMKIFLRDIVEVPGWLASLAGLSTPLTAASRFSAAGQIVDTENIESLAVGIERYADIREPVLLLGGAKSPRHLGERLRALSEVLPNVDSMVILPRQGHAATIFAPREVAGIIASFSDRVLGRDTAGGS